MGRERVWLQQRQPERRRLAMLGGFFLAAMVISWGASLVSRWEPSGSFVVGCFVLWIVTDLRARTTAGDEGLTVRRGVGTDRVPWSQLEAVETDEAGRWATAVLARTKDGRAVRLRGVRVEEVGEVRTAWREAVDR